jgi:RecA-family ATPase
MTDKINLEDVIQSIDPSWLDYSEWANVGMALKEEGYPCSVWDSWSRGDGARYHDGECAKKWNSFNGVTNPVTGGTIVNMAKQYGWRSNNDPGIAYGWDDVIYTAHSKDDDVLVDPSFIEDKTIKEPTVWNPVKEITTYLNTLFDPDDYVGYVVQSYEKDGRSVPTKGNYSRTARQLIDGLKKCKGDIGAVFGDYNPSVGAWIRFNPLDGKGVSNVNVVDFRYALIESDDMALEKQNAIIRELELPVAALVYSGGKSLHAIVNIDAKDYDEYTKRVKYLYDICTKNGMTLDKQNRNPSRLSRLPGIVRGDQKQYIIDTNIGKASWSEWDEWYKQETDIFPDFTTFQDEYCLDIPEQECIIDDLLKPWDKMMIAAPSKSGKTSLVLGLAVAVSEGHKWLGHYCNKGCVIYINFEMKPEERILRTKKIYKQLNIKPTSNNFIALDLKGKSTEIDRLEAKLIRSVKKYNPALIILDPIYKIMIGDENNARDVSKFCNALDSIAIQTGAAIVYCHHHSKGYQGGKTSMDRASGSGVFARDVDALLDMTELELTDEIKEQLHCNDDARGWKIESTLRSFPKHKPFFTIYDFPLYKSDVDIEKTLSECDSIEKTQSNSIRGNQVKSEKAAENRQENIKDFRIAMESLEENGDFVNIKNIAEALDDMNAKTLHSWVKKWRKNGEAYFKIDKENGGKVIDETPPHI